jgi:hypothetical protein
MASAAGNGQIFKPGTQQKSAANSELLTSSFLLRYFLSGVSKHADKHEHALQLMKAHKAE